MLSVQHCTCCNAVSGKKKIVKRKEINWFPAGSDSTLLLDWFPAGSDGAGGGGARRGREGGGGGPDAPSRSAGSRQQAGDMQI